MLSVTWVRRAIYGQLCFLGRFAAPLGRWGDFQPVDAARGDATPSPFLIPWLGRVQVFV